MMPASRRWRPSKGHWPRRRERQGKLSQKLLAIALAHCQAGGISTPAGTMQAMERAARERGADFALVAYPEAEHGFNLRAGLRPGDAEDAWRRANEMLRAHFG